MSEYSTLQNQLRACRLCAQAGYQITGPPIFSGPSSAQVMLIGQAPGYTEVVQQRPFNYTSGTRLFKWLAQAGWEESDFRAQQYMASVTRCYPGRHPSGRGDRVPSAEEIELCRPWREAELSLLPIRLIIPVGKLAISLFMEVKGPLTAIIGQKIELEGRWIVPLPHPSGASTWHMQPQHQPYLEAAIGHLRQLKAELDV